MLYSITNWNTDFVEISQNFMQSLLFSFITYSRFTLYSVALSNFSNMQQILVNSLLIFIPFQIFSSFPCYGFLDTSSI